MTAAESTELIGAYSNAPREVAGPAIWWPDGLKTLTPAPAGVTGAEKTNSTTWGRVGMTASGGGPDWISWAWAKAIWGRSAAAMAMPAIASRRDRLRSRREPRPRSAAAALRPDSRASGGRAEAPGPRPWGTEGPSP